MKTLGINVPCLVNPRRTAVVDSSMRLVIGHDLFYFAGPRERERFVKDPLRYCRRLTDPVTLRRFEPPAHVAQARISRADVLLRGRLHARMY